MLTKLFTCLLVFSCFATHAQHADIIIDTPMQDSIAAGLANLTQVQANLDSMQAKQLNHLKEEAMMRDSINMTRGMDEFVRMQKEKEKGLHSSYG